MQHRVVGLVLALAVTALAGCVDDGDLDVDSNLGSELSGTTQWILDATGNLTDATAFAGELPSWGIVSFTDRVSGEPTIGITPKGSIWYASIDFDYDVAGQTKLPSTVYFRSQDGGATWEGFQPNFAGENTQPTSFDPYVYVDPVTGRVFAMDMGPHVACNNVAWTDDDGATWTTRPGACIPGANDHPSLFAGPATAATNTALYPNHLYLCVNQVSDTLCYNSPDGGINWIAGEPTHLGYDLDRWEAPKVPGNPTNPEAWDAAIADSAFSGLCGGLAGHGHASFATGTVYLGRSYCGDVNVATSNDGGLTWTEHLLATEDPFRATSDHDISVATDSEGNAYAFWIGNFGRALYLATSMDDGNTWSEPMNVTAPGVTAVKLPSIVAGDEGRIAFLYIGTDNPHGHRIGQTVSFEEAARDPDFDCPAEGPCYRWPDALNNTTWNAYTGISLNAHEEAPVFAHSIANPLDEPLKRGTCSGRCPGNGAEGGFYDFIDIEIHPTTGQVYLALVDICTEECDGPGYGAFNSINKSMGTVGIQTGGASLRVNQVIDFALPLDIDEDGA